MPLRPRYHDHRDEGSDEDDVTDAEPIAPDVRDVEALQEAVERDVEAHESIRGGRADKLLEGRWTRHQQIDLTGPGTYGRFVHASIQDAVEEAFPEAKSEVTVDVINGDGSESRGRIDVSMEGKLIEVKTNNLERMSESALIRFLDQTATQVEGYQWSRSLEGKPDAEVFFEFPPKDTERKEKIEHFLHKRGIRTVWGSE